MLRISELAVAHLTGPLIVHKDLLGKGRIRYAGPLYATCEITGPLLEVYELCMNWRPSSAPPNHRLAVGLARRWPLGKNSDPLTRHAKESERVHVNGFGQRQYWQKCGRSNDGGSMSTSHTSPTP